MPVDPVDQYRVQSICDLFWLDFVNPLYNILWSGPGEKEEKDKKATDFCTKATGKLMAAIEKRLKENMSQKFIVGDKWTAADFTLLHFTTGHV